MQRPKTAGNFMGYETPQRTLSASKFYVLATVKARLSGRNAPSSTLAAAHDNPLRTRKLLEIKLNGKRAHHGVGRGGISLEAAATSCAWVAWTGYN